MAEVYVDFTEEELRAQLRALHLTFARGERTVQFADRSVTYATADEIRTRIDYLEALLAAQLATAPRRPRQAFGTASKGL